MVYVSYSYPQFESMQPNLHLFNIINFLKSYKITHIDEQTLVINPIVNLTITQSIDPSQTLLPSQQSYLVKSVNIDQQSCSSAEIIQTLSHHQKLNEKYLLKLLAYEVMDTRSGITIQAIYQYSNRSLKHEILEKYEKASYFCEDQLWAILNSTVNALSHLEAHQIVYGVLGTNRIFIDENIKLLDPSATAIDPLQISEGRLYSPEIINQSDEIDLFQSDIYVLGLILIECGLLIDLSSDEDDNMEKYLQVFSENYSRQLSFLLQKMLMVNPKSRITLQELKQIVSDNFNNSILSCRSVPLIPTVADQEAAENKIEELEELEEEECVDTLSEGQEEKYISEYEKAKMNYLYLKKNKEISPISSSANSQILKIHKYTMNSSSENENSFQIQTKKTKQIKDKIVKSIEHSDTLLDSSQCDDLFTDPDLMRIIRNDLQKFSIKN